VPEKTPEQPVIESSCNFPFNQPIQTVGGCCPRAASLRFDARFWLAPQEVFMRFCAVSTVVLSIGLAAAETPAEQAPQLDIRRIIAAVATRSHAAKQYAFEGDLQLAGQRGEAPGRMLARARVKLAVAPGGRSYLEVEPHDKDAYVLVSDGQRSWAYVPRLKQYTETDGATANTDSESEDGSGEGGSDEERDLAETFAQMIVPTLGRMVTTAESIGRKGAAEVKYEGQKYSWPVLQVLSKKAADGQHLTEFTVDPETLRIGRLVMANVSYRNQERTVIRMTMDFSSFKVGEPVPESTFVFEPPKKAKLVDAVPIPGQTGSFLLNRPAPDFEVKTLDGERVRLTDFRDKPVLLNFWASWCGPCRRELPSVVKLYEELKGKGLVVLGVNDEGKDTAQEYAAKAGLNFPTLDDSRLKLHRLYRVRSIPTIFLIDREGKVVRFLKGARDEAALRSALKGVGL
jgi:thiol-disulfide isomerase/thioredoxin